MASQFRPLSVTDVRLAGAYYTGRFTREHLERSIALVRQQALRLKAYHRAVQPDRSYHRERGEWMNESVFMTDGGDDLVRDDGTLVTPGGTVCASEAYAIDQALQANVNAVDKILHRSHFKADGFSRKKAHPFEKSPTLAQILEGEA